MHQSAKMCCTVLHIVRTLSWARIFCPPCCTVHTLESYSVPFVVRTLGVFLGILCIMMEINRAVCQVAPKGGILAKPCLLWCPAYMFVGLHTGACQPQFCMHCCMLSAYSGGHTVPLFVCTLRSFLGILCPMDPCCIVHTLEFVLGSHCPMDSDIYPLFVVPEPRYL